MGFERGGGVKFSVSPLTRVVALTTLSHYRASVWFLVGYAIILFASCLTLKNIVTLKSTGRLGETRSHWKLHHSARDFLLAFHSKYGPVLYRFPDKARYWLKIVIVFILYLPSTPSLVGIQSEFRQNISYGKLHWWSCQEVKKFEDTYIFLLVRHYRLHERDVHPDRRTSRHGMGAVSRLIYCFIPETIQDRAIFTPV